MKEYKMGCAPSHSVTQCSNCPLPYDRYGNMPMRLPCEHTICATCLNYIYAVYPPLCPVHGRSLPERSSISPDFNILGLLPRSRPPQPPPIPQPIPPPIPTPALQPIQPPILYPSLEPIPHRPVPPPVYPIPTPERDVTISPFGEVMQWTAEEHKCSEKKCGRLARGMLAKGNGYHICYVCYDTKTLTGIKCPSSHAMEWSSVLRYCAKCDNNRLGMGCTVCDYHICFECYQGAVVSRCRCPSDHLMAWISEQASCAKCGHSRQGMKCPRCGYHICYLCYKDPVLTGDKCPTGHSMNWTQAPHLCSIGKGVYPGMKCLEHGCGYHICYKCYKSHVITGTRCPSDHDMRWTQSPRFCAVCNKQDQGMACTLCGYHVCSSCYVIPKR